MNPDTPVVVELPMTQIHAGDNDRTVFKDNDLRSLADSIEKDGLIQPITVRLFAPDPQVAFGGDKYGPLAQYEIVAGERRFRACQLLDKPTINAIVRELTDEQASSLMLAENIHRADIGPIEEAQAYRKRIDAFHWSPAQVAKAAKMNEKRVLARLRLLDLLPEIQALIQSGQLGVQFGECLAPLDSNRQRIAFRYLSGNDRPFLRELQAIVGKLLSDQAQAPMLDLSAFVAQAVEEHNAQHSEWRHRRFPCDESLPLMKRVGTIGLSFETYLTQLLNSPDHQHRAAAPTVGRVYQAMLEGGLCYPPRPERHSPLEKAHD